MSTKEVIDLYKVGHTVYQISCIIKHKQKDIIRTLKHEGIYDEKGYLYSIGKHKCSVCMKVKDISCFQKNTRTRTGLRSSCRPCRKIKEPHRPEYFKKWRDNNKELKSQMDREYRLKNIEKIKSYKKSQHYKSIKRKSDKNYYENVVKKDPNRLIKARTRSLISDAVRYKRDTSTFKILGYTVEELVSHLESNFTEGMSWDNYGRGGWHIDHKKPLASFYIDSDDRLREAWSLDNLQPLWESDNCSKGSFYKGKRYGYRQGSNGKSTKK